MKKLIYLIVLILVLGLIVTGCDNPVVPPAEQDELGSQTEDGGTVTVKESLTVTLTLLDHAGKGLAGGKVKWADGSWHGVTGQTDNNGKITFIISNPNYNKIAMTYNQGTVVQNRVQLETSGYKWQTVQLRIWLKDHNGNAITDQCGRVDQGGGYWYHHGYTNSSGYLDVELFARTAPYKFRMTYNYTSKTQYPVVSAGGGSQVFQTQLAVVTLRENCTAKMIDGAKVSYAGGSWRSFGTTGDDGVGTGSVSKELFPGNRK